ncbi:ABC transporter ATP-binding protein [Poriferisphaera sp. WC338]|uniref:ABC transporter ATP-binding protein n=1 Tax=Poriferisphaera sp. WC338 TaxID=3425129 RepID=UPI003D81549E
MTDHDTGSTSRNTATQAVYVKSLSHEYTVRAERKGKPTQLLALDGVSFGVQQGEIFGVLGPNGGGKSTLFKILSTLMQATCQDGDAQILGHDVRREGDVVRRDIGVVFQSPSLDGKLTAFENLIHQGHLYGLRGKSLRDRAESLLNLFDLGDRKNEYVERFSGGMKRKVEVAKAILHEPKVLLMDEPSTGLDPRARQELWDALEQLRNDKGVTVVLTTHLMEEAGKCDRLGIMSQGKMVVCGEPTRLRNMIGGDVVSVVLESGADVNAFANDVKKSFSPWPEGGEPQVVQANDGNPTIRCEHDAGPELVAKISGQWGGQIQSITSNRPTLMDVFVHVTGSKWDQ